MASAERARSGHTRRPPARLLVSVRNAAEAVAAWRGGADVVDVKDPAAGALGAAPLGVVRAIRAALPAEVPVSAALGDAVTAASAAGAAVACARTGVAFVKIGFAGVPTADVTAILRSAVDALADAAADTHAAPDLPALLRVWVTRHPGQSGQPRATCAVVAVAYADAARVDAPSADAVLDAAVSAGAAGILLDTADKDGPGLGTLTDQTSLSCFVERARQAGLFAAVAGRLTLDDMPRMDAAGADLVGVRGAACTGGRGGELSMARVRRLKGAIAGAGSGQPAAAR